MDRLTPTRTVTATRLITVTTTYETELSETEFLSLTPLENLTTRLLEVSDPVNLDMLAVEILCDYGDLFTEIAAVSDLNPDLQAILAIVNTFDYEQFGKLMLSQYSVDTGYTVLDGNLRSVALALLVKSDQIEYQPVTAMYTEIQQSQVEQLSADEAVLTRTITQAQQGMQHYPISRKR